MPHSLGQKVKGQGYGGLQVMPFCQKWTVGMGTCDRSPNRQC